jgi:hypothetical protein
MGMTDLGNDAAGGHSAAEPPQSRVSRLVHTHSNLAQPQEEQKEKLRKHE